MKLKLFLSLLAFVIISSQLNAQSYRKQQDQVLAYNILTNGIISGIGGIIHKKKNEKLIPVFLKSFGKGCLGGLTKYTAKKQTYYMRNENSVFIAPFNRALFFLGHSISLNGSMNKKVFEQLYFNYMGVNFYYEPYKEKGKRFRSRLSLGTLYSVMAYAFTGNKLDFYLSLEYGQYFFELNPDAELDGMPLYGNALYNAFAIRKLSRNLYAQAVVPHEIIHTYQAYDFFGFSSFYKNKQEAIINSSKFLTALNKYVDFDYEGSFFTLLYQLQPEPRYYKNFFEFEAEHFSRRNYILR